MGGNKSAASARPGTKSGKPPLSPAKSAMSRRSAARSPSTSPPPSPASHLCCTRIGLPNRLLTPRWDHLSRSALSTLGPFRIYLRKLSIQQPGRKDSVVLMASKEKPKKESHARSNSTLSRKSISKETKNCFKIDLSKLTAKV